MSDERQMMQAQEFEVVVIGAGPGGLSTAVTLASYDVPTLVVDRRTTTSTLPRATVASTATMELLRRWGLEPAVRERALDVVLRAWACRTLAEADSGEAVEVGFPTGEQAALISPTAPACIAQDELEPLLEEHLRTLPAARVERGVELVSLEQDSAGHLLTLVDPAGVRQVRARYLVGADGVRSTVREQLGIAARDADGLATGLAIHFRAPLWDLVGEHRYGIYFLTDDPANRSLIPAGKPDRWIMGMHLDGLPEDVDALPADLVERWVREGAGVADLPLSIERVMPVTYGIGLAERFRDGGTFLVGDAAHRVTPRGATGLNTAIHDGFDLGWKLAWVLHGWGDEQLLDSYEHERRPVAEHNASRSTRADGSILGTSFGLSADVGGRIAHVWVPRGEAFVSSLDLLGDGLTLFAGPDWEGEDPAAGTAPPVRLERLDAISARALGLSPAAAVLVRPDGYRLTSEAAMRSIWSRVSTRDSVLWT